MSEHLEAMPLDDLRRRRDAVRVEEEALSYRRRLLHAQIDLVGALAGAGEDRDFQSLLAEALSDGPGGGSGEVRAVTVEADHADDDLTPLPDDLGELSDEERDALLARLRDDEAAISARRRELLTELDAIQAELVERYRRDGVDARQLLSGSD